MKLIAPNVYTFAGLTIGRAYLIDDPDGLTIIDGSLPNVANKIIAQINAAGHNVAEIKQIRLMHAHGDHVGALP